MGPKGLAWTAGVLLFMAALARGEFVPGDIYVADFAEKACAGPYDQYPGDRIYRINPETAEVSLFAALDGPECGGVTGMVFTPDGTRLRVAQYFKNRILEFDSEGNYSVLYDVSDGIFAPLSANCITFDADGNFFVSVFRRILKFAPGNSAPEIFADFQTDPLITHSGPLLALETGELLYGSVPGGSVPSQILRLSGTGQRTIFDITSPRAAVSMQRDSCGNIFAGLDGANSPTPTQLVSYAGDPITKTVLAEGFDTLGQYPVIAIDPTESQLYVHVSRFSPFDISVYDIDSRLLSHFFQIPHSGNSMLEFPALQSYRLLILHMVSRRARRRFRQSAPGAWLFSHLLY